MPTIEFAYYEKTCYSVLIPITSRGRPVFVLKFSALLCSVASSSAVTVYAVQRMDGIGNTQWVVPVDQGTEASIGTLGEGFPTRATWGSVETAQRSGSSTAVSAEDSHHEGGTASLRECTSVSPKTKVEDIRVEAFPRSGFKSRRSQIGHCCPWCSFL